jgi:hypothetical protein
MTVAIFAAFGIAALLLFHFVRPSRAVAITCVAGWLLLPVGDFSSDAPTAGLPYWITGAAVPSDMLLTKMWWPPVIALAGAALADTQSLMRWRPAAIDAPIAMWCLWPLAQSYFVSNVQPQPWTAVAYLAATWGAPWLLGRIYFPGESGKELIAAIVAGLAVIVPIALVEGILGPKLYSWIYEDHPFALDGSQRYLGFRPVGFFEHGNQYGIWVAATALAAIWLWRNTSEPRLWTFLGAAAIAALATVLASQSIGAILLLIGGLGLSWATGRLLGRRTLVAVLLMILAGGAVYLSGAIPLRSIAEKTEVGRRLVEAIRFAGRESFTWRIARDQRALPLIHQHPLVGTARWDWWRPNNERPWGLALLILGQFGLIGLLFAFGSLLIPALRGLAVRWGPGAWRLHPAPPLAVIVVMAACDALLNSFFFYPAILAAGSLAADEWRKA